ncbi:lysoplasmalogenase [Maribellus maritimus]|uniref:lysoplasmalogenase n=1 Tax=Maribellus maritimus TaxID=2870838 RepID=UPI001EEBB828|nr:lysoplasmalogenase [Maribellus maritimus]MCG6185751.1 lysoplasmalogenase [Maribellus maritimus]
MRKVLLHVVFFLIVAGDLAGELFQLEKLDYIFKPLIMVWIAGFFLFYSRNVDRKVVQFAVFAFLFSWFGDILLMFGNDKFLFFVLGLAAFLVAQIIYMNLFLHTINLSGKKPFLKKRPFWLIAYIAYGLIIYILLFEQLDAILRVAVFVYMLALLGMSVMALNRFGNGHPISFSLVFFGSVLFVLSDTMIAINKFLVTIPYEGIFVMVTYIGAQYLIMTGLLKQYE